MESFRTPVIWLYSNYEKEYESFAKNDKKMPSKHFSVDNAFANASYLKKTEISCKRMLSEGLYQAVWFVTVDPKTKAVEEPCLDLSYEKFSAVILGQLDAVKTQNLK